jgi:hypothetical protein
MSSISTAFPFLKKTQKQKPKAHRICQWIRFGKSGGVLLKYALYLLEDVSSEIATASDNKMQRGQSRRWGRTANI